VREQVNFHQANLLDTKISARARAYDFIFCRNLLIYFDRDTQDRAVRKLQGLLAEQGVLFVGPSETGLLLNRNFVSTKIPLAFAFRAVPPSVATAPDSGRVSAPRLPAGARTVTPRAAPVTVVARAALRPSPTVQHNTLADHGIAVASQLADQGELEEAAACCEAHVLQYGPSARAYYLMGTIRAASGHLPEADQFYRKALYLDPNHSDALLHLALLLEKRGSRAEAKVLRARLSRLGQPLATTHES
jgi:chemotaxis protein methyltransferase WspC